MQSRLTPTAIEALYRPTKTPGAGRITVPGIGQYYVAHALGGALVMFRPAGAEPGYFGTVGHTAGHFYAEPGSPASYAEIIALHLQRNMRR